MINFTGSLIFIGILWCIVDAPGIEALTRITPYLWPILVFGIFWTALNGFLVRFVWWLTPNKIIRVSGRIVGLMSILGTAMAVASEEIAAHTNSHDEALAFLISSLAIALVCTDEYNWILRKMRA